MTGKPRILIVDDESEVREMLLEYLGSHDFEATATGSGDGLRAAMAEATPDVILLDVGLPGEDGLSLARWLRGHHDVCIIMVTAAGDTLDRIVGLEVGADDYLSKPFEPRELLARIRSVLRRHQRAPAAPGPADAAPPAVAAGEIRFARFVLDLSARQLRDEVGREVPLTRMEFELLCVLAGRPNRVLSRDDLLQLTQNRDWDPFDRSLDIRIARLRRKIEKNPEHPTIIRTVRGMGYRFVPGG